MIWRPTAWAAMALTAISLVAGISVADVLRRKDVSLQAAQPVKMHTCREAGALLERRLSDTYEKLDLRPEQRQPWQAFTDAISAVVGAVEMVCIERRWAVDHDDPIAAFAYLEFAFAMISEAIAGFHRAAEELGQALSPIQRRLVADMLWPLAEQDTGLHAKHRTH